MLSDPLERLIEPEGLSKSRPRRRCKLFFTGCKNTDCFPAACCGNNYGTMKDSKSGGQQKPVKFQERPRLTCLRCFWRWTPQVDDPRVCPHCKSPNWNSTPRAGGPGRPRKVLAQIPRSNKNPRTWKQIKAGVERERKAAAAHGKAVNDSL